MAKVKSAFFCQNCGTQYAKWVGHCTACKEWNTVVEEIIQKEDKAAWEQTLEAKTTKSVPLAIGDIKTDKEIRIILPDDEMNRVLGGGLVPGSLILVGGEPGIGKSTLLLQIALNLRIQTLYVTGEESQRQIKMRANRLKAGGDHCLILTETNTQKI